VWELAAVGLAPPGTVASLFTVTITWRERHTERDPVKNPGIPLYMDSEDEVDAVGEYQNFLISPGNRGSSRIISFPIPKY